MKTSGKSRNAGFRAWTRAWLTHRQLPLALAVLAGVLALPSLWVGWVADDHFHRLRLVGTDAWPELAKAPMDLFVFASGDPNENRRYIDIGLWPWWTLPELRGAFFRPITVFTHWLDYQLWPDRPAIMHAHSVVWFALAVAAVALLYRRLLGLTLIAGLAALLYAIDDARGMPVGFLANRNALVASLFGVLAIHAHVRWRGEGWRAGAVLGPALLLAGLLSAEIGIGAVGYIFAHAVYLDRASLGRRVAVLMPYAVVVLGWRIVWSHLGYGVWGMDFYVDPLTEPIRFALALPERLPLLLLGQLLLPPADGYVLTLGTGAAIWFWAAACGLLIPVVLILARRLRWRPETRFWAMGMALSLVPVCATFASDRLLFFPGLGGFALVAQYLTQVFDKTHDPDAAGETWAAWRFTKVLGVALVVVHLGIAPVFLAVRCGMPVGPPGLIENMQAHLPPDADVAGRTVVVVESPLPLGMGHLPIRRALDGLPVPAHTRALAPHYFFGASNITVIRSDDRTLLVSPEQGYLLLPGDRLARGLDHPLALGERVELSDMTAEVTALNGDGRPAEVAFRFSVPLEDPSLLWLTWQGDGFGPFTPPPAGTTTKLTQ